MHRRRSRIVLPVIFITSVTSSKRNNGEKKNRDVREILIQIDCRIKYSTRIVRIRYVVAYSRKKKAIIIRKNKKSAGYCGLFLFSIFICRTLIRCITYAHAGNE